MEMDSNSNASASAATDSAGIQYAQLRDSLLNTKMSELTCSSGTDQGQEAPELNPGVLGIQELRIPVPWGHVAAKAWGNSASGKPCLAVHGWMDNCGSFDRLIPLLPQSLYIVAIDVPGHGLSSHLPLGITYHYIDFVTLIRRIISHLGWDHKKFIYIGHSMGGALGIVFASLFPAMVDRLVTLDQVVPATDVVEDIPGRLTSGICTTLAMDALEEKETKNPPTYSSGDAVGRLMKYTLYCEYPLTLEAARTLIIRGTRPVTPGKVAFTRDHRLNSANFMRFTPEAMLAIISKMSCHVLMIKAQHSITLPKPVRDKAIHVYNQKCASFKLVEVPGNHFVHLNQPEAVAQHLTEFLL